MSLYRILNGVLCGGCRCCVYVWTVLCFQLIVFQRVLSDCNTAPASGALTNATTERFADDTTLEYFCGTGYNVVGRPVHRTCLGEDQWTEGPDTYHCQLKVTSIVTACVVSVFIIVLFIILVFCALKRLRRPKKDIEHFKGQEGREIGQDNPYFITNGARDEDLNLDLFEMDREGYISEGTTDNNDTDEVRASTLPRPTAALPELPANELRYSTLPKTFPAGSGAVSSNGKDKNHIYDSIKHAPPELGQSMQINNEPFTRL